MTVDDAMIKGWEACRLSIFAVCEDVDREATQDWPDGNLQARGMMRAAKSISRGFGAMQATDDDNLTKMLDSAKEGK